MDSERPSVRSWITDGIILAGIPATAYLWALSYEIAYSSYFSMPWYFISLSSVNVLAIVRLYIIPLALIYFLLILFIAMRPLGTHLDRFASRSPRHKAIVTFFMFLTLSGVSLLWSFLANELLWRIILKILAVCTIAAFFVRPLFRQYGTEGNYWDKLIADQIPHPRISTKVSTPSPSPTSAFRDFIEVFVIITTIFLIVYGTYLFPTAGRMDAQGQEWFQVVAQSLDVPEVVVLRCYGDNLFAAPLNRSTKEVEKKLFILKISEMGKRPLTTEKVGPLTVKQ